MKRLLILLIIFILPVFSQEDSFFCNVYKGFSNSISYKDIPIYTAYFLRSDIQNQFKDGIHIRPFQFESSIIKALKDPQHKSPGSINQHIIPYIFLSLGWITTASLDLFTDTQISDKDYERLFSYKKTLIYTYTLTEIVKSIVKRDRPDGSDNRSFFSGHTSTAFASSTFLYLTTKDFINNSDLTNQKKELLKVISFSVFYGWAAYVGYSRMADKKHYFTDVLAGALAGTIISSLIYKNHFRIEVTQEISKDYKGIILNFAIN